MGGHPFSFHAEHRQERGPDSEVFAVALAMPNNALALSKNPTQRTLCPRTGKGARTTSAQKQSGKPRGEPRRCQDRRGARLANLQMPFDIEPVSRKLGSSRHP